MESDRIYILIANRLAGETTPEEKEELNLWLEQSEENRKLFRQYELLWQRTQQLYKQDEPDVETCFHEFEKICFPLKNRRISWMRYAAAIVIPVFLSVGAYLMFHNYSTGLTEVQETFALNSQKVQLLLSDGQKYELTADRNTAIRENHGITIHQKGNVLNYTSDTANTVADPQVQYNTLIVPRGAEYSLVLADGTRIFLNSESELKYPVQFHGNERQVYLKGEAYFDVAKDTCKPFIVSVQQLDIRVLGTAFNVMAYADVPDIQTTLERGCVQVKGPEGKLLLHPGMQAVFRKADASLIAYEVNTLLYTSWKDDKMVFENLRLEELLDRLGRWYDFTVFYLNPSVKDICLTGHLSKHDDINSILELVETMGKVQFAIQGRTISVSENFK